MCIVKMSLIAYVLDTKKIGTEVFGEIRNEVLEENGEDKMVKEVTNEQAYRREEDTSK